MTLLIHGRCDLDKPDRSGDTALHLAAAVWRDGGERERGVGGLVEVRWGAGRGEVGGLVEVRWGAGRGEVGGW